MLVEKKLKNTIKKPSSNKMDYDTTSSSSSLCPDVDDDFYAANLGYRDAQYNVGLYFHNGYDVPRCYTRALHFFCLAARQGHARAMHMIGICYKFGEGIVLDNKMALQWFLFSSAHGNNLSNYEIGFMYYHGYGVEQCYRTAEYHLKIGIDNGDDFGIQLYNDTLAKLRVVV